MSAAADVLNGAADLIERDGWCQGSYRVRARRCTRQALADAASTSRNVGINWYAFNKAGDAMHHQIADYDTIWAWNDTPGRTQAEVVAALRAAARRAG